MCIYAFPMQSLRKLIKTITLAAIKNGSKFCDNHMLISNQRWLSVWNSNHKQTNLYDFVGLHNVNMPITMESQ